MQTDHHQAIEVEQALRASEAQLAEIVEIAEDAIISVDAEQRIVRFNRGATKIFGWAPDEVVGQPLDILLPARFRGIHHAYIVAFSRSPETARRMGDRSEIWGVRKDGTEFPAEASISKLITGQHILFTVILRDVTDRKQVADALESQVAERTGHLNILLQFSGELLVARGLDTVLQRALAHAMELVPQANRGVIRLYDRQTDNLALRASVGWPVLPPVNVAPGERLGGRAFSTGQIQVANSRVEAEVLLPSYAPEMPQDEQATTPIVPMPTGAIAIPLAAHDQKIGALVLLRMGGDGPFAADARQALIALSNLTGSAILEEYNQQQAAALTTQVAELEQQQRHLAERLNAAEAGMLQAARLAAVGQLAASIAHEINNPLYAARNALFLVEEDVPPEVRNGPYLKLVSEQLARIAGITERMRDFYRPQRGEFAPTDINHLLEETLAVAGLNRRFGGIDITFAPATDLPPVLGSSDQLRQVFLNLLLNALDAMPDGGNLTVRTAAIGVAAVVEIVDTGVGIPDDVRSHLFEPFWTSKSNGTGLGLSISAHIVTQHGGHIEVDSVPGKGSTFRVVLPFNQ